MKTDLKEICKDIRCDLMTCVGHLGVGHIGGSLSIVELLAVLYFKEMNIDPTQPKMAGRDRFICSKGHAGPAVYATLANRGYFSKDELLTLNRSGTHLPSHCDMNLTTGIDMTTGSLGQGFSCAVGAALGSKLLRDGARVYTVIGDGETQEGQIWEAAMFAASRHLDNLVGFTDYNRLQLDGYVENINDIAPLADKWKAFGWAVVETDGHDMRAILNSLHTACSMRKPTVILMRTVKGKGVSFMEDESIWHGKAPNEDEMLRSLMELGNGEAEQ